MKTITYAIRFLLRSKSYTIINLLGLAFSLACCIILMRYIHRELTVNDFKGKERIFLVTNEYDSREPDFGNITGYGSKPFTDEQGHSAVEASADFHIKKDDFITKDEKRFNTQTMIVSENFLDILPFHLVSGKREMSSPNDVVISQKFAQKLFGNEHPIGQTFLSSANKSVTVVGVVDTEMPRSSFEFDLLLPISHKGSHWGLMFYSLARLQAGHDYQLLNQKEEVVEFPGMQQRGIQPFRSQLFPLTDFYFDTTINVHGWTRHGNKQTIIVLYIIIALLFGVGLFNYTNIQTVLTLKRGREFGIKKVFGAGQGQVFIQLWVENVLIIFGALMLTGLFVEVVSVLLASGLDMQELTPDYRYTLTIMGALLLILPILVTIYPFLRYSLSAPITSLRSVTIGGKSIVSRSIFLMMQYIITASLIIFSTFAIKQLHGMLHADLGFRPENIMQCTFLSYNNSMDFEEMWKQNKKKAAVIVEKLKASPLVEQWDFARSPLELTPFVSFQKKGEENAYTDAAFGYYSRKFFDMLGIPVKEGRMWIDSLDMAEDYHTQLILINETAQKTYGITDISKESLQNRTGPNRNYKIVGVIGDFQVHHLSQKPFPLACAFEPEIFYEGRMDEEVFIKFHPDNKQKLIDYMTEVHREVMGEGEFKYTFLENEIEKLYAEDYRTASIYSIFALIALLISCLGLYGISLYDVRQRYREIALRKVHGATLRDLLVLLTKKYAYLLIASFMVSIPMSYAAIQYYLQDFAYQESVSWWIFALSAIITTGISYATLIGHTIRAANIDPAVVMKSE